MDGMRFDTPPELVLSILNEAATGDPTLALHLSAATWKAAAIHMKQQEGERADTPADQPEVPE